MRVYRYELRRKTDARAAELLSGYGIVTSDGIAADIIRRLVGERAREHFVVVYLDVANRVAAYELIAIGSEADVHVTPREVFRGALVAGANAIIIGHNHPSGQACASADDDAITARLVNAGAVLGVQILDHVVVTSTSHFSYFATGRLPKACKETA